MPSRNLLLLLIFFMAQHQDMGFSSPIHGSHFRNCQWNELKNLTKKLYNQALNIYESTNSTGNTDLDDVPRIECHHHCGPKDLMSNPETCLKRIFLVLSYYGSALSVLSNSSQYEDFIKAKELISEILHLLQACDYSATNLTKPNDVSKDYVIRKIGSPLLSVSILTARVFSPGNPANHIIHPTY